MAPHAMEQEKEGRPAPLGAGGGRMDEVRKAEIGRGHAWAPGTYGISPPSSPSVSICRFSMRRWHWSLACLRFLR